MSADDKHHVAAYPKTDEYERWTARADELGYRSQSQFVQDMVRAGIRADQGFDTQVERDESIEELRTERNKLKSELEKARGRLSELREQAYSPEREMLRQYLMENPDAEFSTIVEYMRARQPTRIHQILDGLYVEPEDYDGSLPAVLAARQEDRS